MSDNVYKCSICGKTYCNPKIAKSCLVLHPEGQCCHYGEEEIANSEELLKQIEKTEEGK